MIKNIFKKKPKEIKFIPEIYYTDCEIPAKLFFDIWHTSDYSKLGTDAPEKLEDAFMMIFDEYVNLDSNEKIMQWYKKQLKIQLIQTTINTINTCLYHIAYSSMTKEEFAEAVKIINSIKGANVRFNINKDPLDEITRVQTSVIGILENQLNIELESEEKVKEKVQYHFEQDLVSIENMLERSIPDGMTLKKFVFLKKAAIERSENLKKLQQKNGSK